MSQKQVKPKDAKITENKKVDEVKIIDAVKTTDQVKTTDKVKVDKVKVDKVVKTDKVKKEANKVDIVKNVEEAPKIDAPKKTQNKKKVEAPKDVIVAADANDAIGLLADNGEEVGNDNKKRHFKVIMNGCEIKDAKGRFSGKKPKQAANKALTSIVKKFESEEKPCPADVKFTLIECTRKKKEDKKSANKKALDKKLKNKAKKKYKQYHYIGNRIESAITYVIIVTKEKKESILNDFKSKNANFDETNADDILAVKEFTKNLKKTSEKLEDDELTALGLKRIPYKYNNKVTKDPNGVAIVCPEKEQVEDQEQVQAIPKDGDNVDKTTDKKKSTRKAKNAKPIQKVSKKNIKDTDIKTVDATNNQKADDKKDVVDKKKSTRQISKKIDVVNEEPAKEEPVKDTPKKVAGKKEKSVKDIPNKEVVVSPKEISVKTDKSTKDTPKKDSKDSKEVIVKDTPKDVPKEDTKKTKKVAK